MADEFCLEMPDFHVTFMDLLHAVNLRHGTDGFTSPPKEGVLRIFSPWKVQRLRSGLNPRTWVPKASTLTLDHRSRSGNEYAYKAPHWPLNTEIKVVSQPTISSSGHRIICLICLKTFTSFYLLKCYVMQTKKTIWNHFLFHDLHYLKENCLLKSSQNWPCLSVYSSTEHDSSVEQRDYVRPYIRREGCNTHQ